MSIESAFEEAAGPSVGWLRIRSIDNGKKYEFIFRNHHCFNGVLDVVVGDKSDNDVGRIAGRRARKWADEFDPTNPFLGKNLEQSDVYYRKVGKAKA